MQKIERDGIEMIRLCTCESLKKAQEIAAKLKIKDLTHATCLDCFKTLYPEHLDLLDPEDTYRVFPKF
jgi:hypothetical protein